MDKTDVIKCNALAVDTCVFEQNGMRLESGLLGKLSQFKGHPATLVLPDVVVGEIRSHLNDRVATVLQSLKKAIREAVDQLIVGKTAQNDLLPKSLSEKNTLEFSNKRVDDFLGASGASIIKCGDYVNVTHLLERYFSNGAPFEATGQKKHEFPDALALLALEAWAKLEDRYVLAVSTDKGWERYCTESERLLHIDNLADALAALNSTPNSERIVRLLASKLSGGGGKNFLKQIEDKLRDLLNDFTPEQDADSAFFWEPEGCNGWFESFNLEPNDLAVIETDETTFVLRADASITIGAEGHFSLSVHDSIDRDSLLIDTVAVQKKEEFDSEILITVSGEIKGNVDDLLVEAVEITTPPRYVHFGWLEPDLSDD